MLTTEKLRQLGVNVDDALERLMNNESFYLRLVEKVLDDGNFARLERAVEAGDWHEGFEAAHALKGSVGNLSLTPLYTTICELTELLRPGLPVDARELIKRMRLERERLLALRDGEAEKSRL